MRRKLGILGGVLLVALVFVTLAGTALAQPPTPTPPRPGYGLGFLDRVTLQRAAALLGTTPAELAAQLQQGRSLAQLAQAKGVTEQALTDTSALIFEAFFSWVGQLFIYCYALFLLPHMG